MHSRSWRFIPAALVACVLLAAMALSAVGADGAVERAIAIWLVEYQAPPFADAYGITSAIECERAGVETYLANPCHYRPGAFVYPPTWKLLTVLPMTRAWTPGLTALLIAAFLAALCALPAVDTRSAQLGMVLAVLSPASLLMVDYGNNEMLIFALATLAAVLLGRGDRARAGAYALVLVAGLLKYFPFALLAVALRERARMFAAIVLASLAVLVAFVLLAGEQLGLSLANIVVMSPFSLVFGARNPAMFAAMAGAPPGIVLLVRLAVSAAVPAIAFAVWRKPHLRAAVRALPAAERMVLIVGALLLVAAFVATQNVDYRQIYTLMVLPALFRLARDPAAGRIAWLPWTGIGLMYAFSLRMWLRAPFLPGSFADGVISLAGIFLRDGLWIAYAGCLLGLAAAALGPLPLLSRKACTGGAAERNWA